MKKRLAILLLALVAWLSVGCPAQNNNTPKPTTFGAGGVRPPIINPFWAQATWDIDPANSSGTASDANDGLTTSTPLLHWSEMQARWATTSPILAQATTITIMSAEPSNGEADPVVFAPIIRNTGSISILGALTATTQTATGTITITTSKVRGTSDLVTSTGAITALSGGNLLVNSTHVSRAINVGATGLIAQPMTGTTSNSALPTEVDTWATSDSYTAYNQPLLNILSLNCIVSDLITSTPCLINAIQFADPGANSSGAYESVTVAGPWVISDSAINRSIVSVAGGGHTPALRLIDNYYNGNVAILGPPPASVTANVVPNGNSAINSQVTTIFGGNTNGGANTAYMNLTNVWLDYDIRIMDSTIAVLEGTDFYGCVELASSARLRTAGAYVISSKSGACSTNAIVWSPSGSTGQITLDGTSRWSYTGGTATATFLGLGGLSLNNRASTACSHSNASPDVVSCGITINVANLDAAQGVSGFGGLAYIPGGSSFTSVP